MKSLVKAEPAIVAGLLGTIALALNGATNWEDAMPLVVTAILRAFVSPAHKVKKLEEELANYKTLDNPV